MSDQIKRFFQAALPNKMLSKVLHAGRTFSVQIARNVGYRSPTPPT
jgi:hypothetical protein